MAHVLSVLLALAAGAEPAANASEAAAPSVVVRAEEPDDERVPVRLAAPDDVTRLCQALEPTERLRTRGDALERGEAEARHESEREAAVIGRYVVVVPAAKLAFAPYDRRAQRLELVEPAPVVIAGGSAKVWLTLDRSLPVEIDEVSARRILDAQRGGSLSLGLVFDLPDDATCGKLPRGKQLTIPAEPVSWRWTDGEAELALGGDAADQPTLAADQGARPRVDVGDPIAGPPEAKNAVLAREVNLEACYLEALRRDPSMDGVLVADLGGARPAITADSVGDSELAACVRKVLEPLAPAQGRPAVPIRFVLELPGAARGAGGR